MATPKVEYIHNYDAAVVRTHGSRTVANSAAYLISSLNPNMSILDVGCGPGSITIDFAQRAPGGQHVGVDISSTILDAARGLATKEGVSNVRFVEADLTRLDFPDDSFDLVHAHQVVQYQKDQVAALKEMRRVAKPGGLVAAREWDASSMTWFPLNPVLEDFKEKYVAAGREAGGEPNAGRRLVAWAVQAGFKRSDITASGGTWCYSDPEERAWYGGLMIDRLTTTPIKFHPDPEENEKIKAAYRQAWKEWSEQEDAWFGVLQGEIICKK